jgi:hypothetical protein
VRGFLARKRREIRSAVFNNHRQTYILLTSGMDREIAKGLVLVVPGIILLFAGADTIALLALGLGVFGFLAWMSFVLAVAIKAGADKSDGIYERFTRKHLSKEYRDG